MVAAGQKIRRRSITAENARTAATPCALRRRYAAVMRREHSARAGGIAESGAHCGIAQASGRGSAARAHKYNALRIAPPLCRRYAAVMPPRTQRPCGDFLSLRSLRFFYFLCADSHFLLYNGAGLPEKSENNATEVRKMADGERKSGPEELTRAAQNCGES